MRNQLPQNFSFPTIIISSFSTVLFGALVLSGANNIAFSAMLCSGSITTTMLLVEFFRK